MKKPGMVLMMTLVLITVMMGIVAVVLTQNERLSRVRDNAFNQSIILRIVNDLEQQLPSLLSAITGPEQLDLMVRLPLQLESKKKDFILKGQLSSIYGRLNINRIISSDGKINEAYVALLMRIFAVHPIADSDMLMKLILDTVDTDIIERGTDTEIALIQPDFKNGSIVDSLQFNSILERYVNLTRDTTVLSIPWEDYIGYDGEKMDFNALNAETLSLILPNVSPEKIRELTLFRTKAYTTKEEVITAEPALASVFDSYFFIYKAGDSYDVLCDVRVSENTHNEHIKFHYNLLDKKIRQVEFL
ncbi:MAG: hypothetical protein Q8S36_10895 [Sulfuricurvum sp.]|nr:hypothetical protein [Sulfuricurvum sp.]